MKKKAILFFVSLLVFSGCTGLRMSLLPSTKPLEEQDLQGRGKAKILLVDLDGVISFKEESDALKLKTTPSPVAFFREALRKAEQDPDIAGVILRINSPGGTVAASDTIYHEILAFRQKKKVPVYAHIIEIGASGGYYVACAADRILASPAAVTGSIGVIALRLNLSELFSKIGVAEETYKSGPQKDFWSPFRASTPEEKKMMQGIIDQLYARFLDAILASRQKVLSMADLKALADGRVFTAGEALKVHLIDQVSYLDETIDTLQKDLHLEQARVVTYIRPRTFKSNIYSGYADNPSPSPQGASLISIHADALSLFPGVHFMYLWNP